MNAGAFVDDKVASDPLRRRLRRLARDERREEAAAFISLFYRENRLSSEERDARWREVARDLSRHGFYRHTSDELAFGARVAWRNHSRCIGRLHWKSLEVVDNRDALGPDDVAARVFDHLVHARADGRIRSVISVFAPVEGDALPAWIENRQAVQYAGYVRAGGVLGDPATVEFTRIAMALGWRPPEEQGRFDILPLIVRDRTGRRFVYDLPSETIHEAAIAHPDRPGLAALGLRWYTVPLVSDLILTIGGIDYPCAPFNGWYMATEIANRNLSDSYRYNLLEPIADALGTERSDPLWKDLALTELNRAVLFSFRRAGATVVDHHSASAQYVDFEHAERSSDRIPSSDWSWIVPPQAGSACPVYHLPMRDLHDVPNFYRSRAMDGGVLHVSRATEQRGRTVQRLERLRRRWRNWRRRHD